MKGEFKVEQTPTVMEALITNLTSFATWSYTQLTTLMGKITAEPALFIVIFGVGIVGFGVGLLKRLVKL